MTRLALFLVLVGCSDDGSSRDERLKAASMEANKRAACVPAAWPTTGFAESTECARACTSKPPAAQIPSGATCEAGIEGGGRVREVDGFLGTCVQKNGFRSDGAPDVIVDWVPCYCAEQESVCGE